MLTSPSAHADPQCLPHINKHRQSIEQTCLLILRGSGAHISTNINVSLNWSRPLFLLKPQLPALLSSTFLYKFLTFVFYYLFQVSTLFRVFTGDLKFHLCPAEKFSSLCLSAPIKALFQDFFHQKVHQISFLNIVTSTLYINYATPLECKIFSCILLYQIFS